MNVKVFGKDTVNITGLIEVDEATLFMNLYQRI